MSIYFDYVSNRLTFTLVVFYHLFILFSRSLTRLLLSKSAADI